MTPINLIKNLTWNIILPDGKIIEVEDSVISDDEGPNEEFSLLELLQELKYVVSIDAQEYNKTRIDLVDEIWTYLLALWLGLKQQSADDMESFHSDDSRKADDGINQLRGNEYENMLQSIDGPYLFRYRIYKIFKALFSFSGTTGLGHILRDNVVFDAKNFENCWNNGTESFALVLKNIQTITDLGVLQRILEQVTKTKTCYNFRNAFFPERKGCFLLAHVSHPNYNHDLLCFSGVREFGTSIKNTILRIKNSGYFTNPMVITAVDNIHYYISPLRSITYKQAKDSGLKFSPRMFSCCERKVFAGYDWSSVLSFKMIVKYQPCELCDEIVEKYLKGHCGRIVYGIRLKAIDKSKFDSLANDIYNKWN